MLNTRMCPYHCTWSSHTLCHYWWHWGSVSMSNTHRTLSYRGLSHRSHYTAGCSCFKIWCCHHNHLLDSSVETDEPLDCLRKRGIRGRHWSVFLKEEKKRAERKHWSKNPDVCGSTSLLLLPGYFHPVRVTWTPRTMTFSCALSENDRIISQRGFSFHFDHDNLSQYMVLQ